MTTTATSAPARPAAHAAAASTAPLPARRRASARTGAGITAFVGLFLLADAVFRIAGFAPYIEGTVQFGYAEDLAPWIGASLLVSTVLYLIPRTAVLGAILVTGYLGGAVATHVRVEDPSFLFAGTFGVLTWLGLYLREERLRALLPLRHRVERPAAGR